MKNKQNKIIEIARTGKTAAVELIGHSFLQVHFMNVSFRLCKKQFENFTVMLNEAMMQLVKDDPDYFEMKKFYNLNQSLMDRLCDEDEKDKLN